MLKTPKKLTTEELLANLDNAHDNEIDVSLDDNSIVFEIMKFIDRFELDTGKYEVHKKYIYQLYRASVKLPIDSYRFYIHFNTIYPYSSRTNFYLVNKNLPNILKLVEQVARKDRFIRSKYNPKLINNLKAFLTNADLKPGNYWVESFVLTELYDDFRKLQKKPRYHAKTITQALGMFFETSKTSHGDFVWFKINKKLLDIFNEVRYNEYINTRGFEWWKNLPKEVSITEESERKKKAKNAISSQNRKYREIYKKRKLRAEKRKSTRL